MYDLDTYSLHKICTHLSEDDVDSLVLASPLTFCEVLRARKQPFIFRTNIVKALGWLSRRRAPSDTFEVRQNNSQHLQKISTNTVSLHNVGIIRFFFELLFGSQFFVVELLHPSPRQAAPPAGGGPSIAPLDLGVELQGRLPEVTFVCDPAILYNVGPAVLRLVTSFSSDYRPVVPSEVPYICGMTALTALVMVGPDLATQHLERLGKSLPSLRSLEFREQLPLNVHFHDGEPCTNHLDDPFTHKRLEQMRKDAPELTPKFLNAMPSLEALTMETFRMRNSWWSHLPPSLTRLDLPLLQRDQLTSRGVKQILARCPGLQELSLERGYHNINASSVIAALAGHIAGPRGNNVEDRYVAPPPLNALTRLDLADLSQLKNADLTHIARLTSLRSLILSGCIAISDEGLLSLAPLKQLTELEMLNMDGEQEDEAAGEVGGDAGLRALAALSSLQVLKLPDDPQVPVTSEGLRALTDGGLRLQRLEITGQFHDLSPLTALGPSLTQLVLWVEMDELPPAQLRHFEALTALKCLSLTGTTDAEGDHVTWLDPLGLTSLARLTGLTYLTLDSVAMHAKPEDEEASALARSTPELFEHVARLSALETLELISVSHVDCRGLSHLSALTALTRMSLDSLLDMVNDHMALLPQISTLQSLELGHLYSLTYQWTDILRSMPQLTELGLTDMSLLDLSFVAFTALTNLVDLRVYMSAQPLVVVVSTPVGMTGSGLYRLGALKKLQRLAVEGYSEGGCACFRRIDDRWLAKEVCSLPCLETLRLQGIDAVTAKGILSLTAHTRLREVILRDCREIEYEDQERIRRMMPRVRIDWHPEPDPDDAVSFYGSEGTGTGEESEDFEEDDTFGEESGFDSAAESWASEPDYYEWEYDDVDDG